MTGAGGRQCEVVGLSTSYGIATFIVAGAVLVDGFRQQVLLVLAALLASTIFCFTGYGDHLDLHTAYRRQRRMCIRDRLVIAS